MLGLATTCFIYYRKSILKIAQHCQYRCTQLQYRFAVISEAPSTRTLVTAMVCTLLLHRISTIIVLKFKWNLDIKGDLTGVMPPHSGGGEGFKPEIAFLGCSTKFFYAIFFCIFLFFNFPQRSAVYVA